MTTATHSERSLYLAMEIGNEEWVLRFGDLRQERGVSIPARDQERLWREIGKAKVKFGLPAEAPVHACYEAGRDGFWIQRMLCEGGVNGLVVDSSSLEVNRRARRLKTDRIDARKLLNMLVRHVVNGEKKLWVVLHVPSEEEEMRRRLHRGLERLKKERRSHLCRIGSLLVTLGIRARGVRKLPLKAVVDWKGRPLPEALRAELALEYRRLELVDEQIQGIEKQRQQQMKAPSNRTEEVAVKLEALRGLGADSGWQLAHEFFWRRFDNRRQVGSAAGLTGCPYDSGNSRREQGISKAGNARVRTLMVEMAWRWLQFQPGSTLSRWFQEHFGGGSGRMRRIGIVALARKLLVALWKYLEWSELPEGAVLKA
jgi:transposase